MTNSMCYDPRPNARNGSVHLCDYMYWDGGEYVYCHAPAFTRDRDRTWVCAEHDPGR